MSHVARESLSKSPARPAGVLSVVFDRMER